jgi:hypothetical protein
MNVWILNSVYKPVLVGLGSAEMMNAANTYMSEADAKKAQRELCPHTTMLGHSGTGYIACADCGKPKSEMSE